MAHASGKSTPPRSNSGDGPSSAVAAESTSRGLPAVPRAAADQSRSLPKLDLERLARSSPKVGRLLSYSKLPIPPPPLPTKGRSFGPTILRAQQAPRVLYGTADRQRPIDVSMEEPVSVVMEDPVSVVMEDSVSVVMEDPVSLVIGESVSVVMEESVRVAINAPFRAMTPDSVSVVMDKADSSVMHEEFSVLMQSVTPAPKVRAVRTQATISAAIWFGCGVLVLLLGGVVAWRSSTVLRATPMTLPPASALAAAMPTVARPTPEPARLEPAPVVSTIDRSSKRMRRREARTLRRQKLRETRERKHELRKRLKREKRKHRHARQ